MQWFKNSIYHSVLLITGNLSSLQSLHDYETTDGMIEKIQRLYQEIWNTKLIFFTRVRGHTGVEGNKKTDSLPKEAAQHHQLNTRFILFPHSHLKYKLKHNLIQNWQQLWD